MIIAQSAPPAVLIEWIKKQREDLRYQGFGRSRKDAAQATKNYNDESTSLVCSKCDHCQIISI